MLKEIVNGVDEDVTCHVANVKKGEQGQENIRNPGTDIVTKI